MHRREFLEKTSRVVGGLPFIPLVGTSVISFLEGCSKKGNEPETPKDYVPDSDRAFFPRDYSLAKSVSDSAGVADFRVNGEHYNLLLRDSRNGRGVSGLEASFCKDEISNNGFIIAKDPSKRYFPGMISFSKGLAKRTASEDWGDVLDIFVPNEVNLFRQLYIIYNNDQGKTWPTIDLNKIGSKPGFVYIGDWSFNNIKNANNSIKKVSQLITLVAPNQPTAVVLSITTVDGVVIDQIENVIDFVNDHKLFNVHIDKDSHGSWYVPNINSPSDLIFLLNGIGRNNKENVKDLMQFQPGNSWTYSGSGNLSMWVESDTKNIGGKELVVLKDSSGVEQYVGFKKDELRYYGFNYQGLEVMLDPGIIMGNGSIGVGSVYKNENPSKIIVKDHPEISGSVEETITVEGREDLSYGMFMPFGDCYRIKDKAYIEMKKGSDSFSDSSYATYWNAKNVGRVKILSQGNELNLSDIDVNSVGKRTIPNNFEVSVLPITSLIAKSVLKLI